MPLLLSRHLRSTARRYDDVAELELRDDSGNPVAEADLIAAGNDQVIVAEAKSNDALGKNSREVKRAAAKRVMLAGVLRADQIILATTQPGWDTSSLTGIRNAVTGHAWPAGLRPAVRLITGLGSDHTEDLRLDLVTRNHSQMEPIGRRTPCGTATPPPPCLMASRSPGLPLAQVTRAWLPHPINGPPRACFLEPPPALSWTTPRRAGLQHSPIPEDQS